jgi:N utilization substance protein B
MLSRRNVRVKVMQTLYAQNRDQSLSHKDVLKMYNEKIEESFDLLLFSLYNLLNIAKVATEDFQKRKVKHLPSDIDKVFEPKLWDNIMVQSLMKNPRVIKLFEKKNFAQKVDKDHFNKIYFDFSKEESYLDFIRQETNEEQVLDILLELFRFCRKNELFIEIIEDNFANWEDDKSLIIGAIKKILKAQPAEDQEFLNEYYPDDETVKEYGYHILDKTLSDEKVLMSYIEPVLQNWDSERVAIIDMIILKMAIIEFIYCPSIPSKVTINEYVELSKTYSTSKSKEFINGILDKILKELISKDLVKKEGRGLLD